jgi:hypothetical protein
MTKMASKWIPIWAVPLLVAFAVGTVWVRLTIVKTTYAINETDRMISSLEQAREEMELKVAGLRSPRRLELLARTRYGLSQPSSQQMVHLK